MIEERQWLPNPPPPWYWQLTTRWELVHQDPREGIVVGCYVERGAIGDPEVLAMIETTIEALPPTYIAKSRGA